MGCCTSRRRRPTMNGAHYRLEINGDAPLLGRDALLRDIIGWLTGIDTVHVSLVGPQSIGKTVILRHLARDLSWAENYYQAVIYLDLRLRTPSDDRSFMQLLGAELRDALASHPELASKIDPNSPDLHATLMPLFKFL